MIDVWKAMETNSVKKLGCWTVLYEEVLTPSRTPYLGGGCR